MVEVGLVYLNYKKINSMEINYIGDNLKIINLLNKNDYFRLNNIFCITRKRYHSIKKKINKKINYCSNLNNLEKKILNKKKNNEIFIIYECPLIISKKLLDKHQFFNLHRGSLKFNRGPIPEVWTILNGDKNAYFTLHKINEKIDLGEIIFQEKISLNKRYNVLQLRKLMEKKLEKLIRKLYLYLKKRIKTKKIRKGKYNSFLTESDYTINLKKDSFNTIKNKIFSQQSLKGAVIIRGKKKFYIKSILELQKLKKTIGHG